MKTAISVPDDTFDRATQRAADLGVSRSEFFARAAENYLDDLDDRSLTQDIDTALERLGTPDASVEETVAVGHRLLAGVDDEW